MDMCCSLASVGRQGEQTCPQGQRCCCKPQMQVREQNREKTALNLSIGYIEYHAAFI